MKLVSKAALAIALAVATVSTVGTVPAAAQSMKVSKEFRTAAVAAEAALKAGDLVTAETNTTLAESIAKNDDERYFAAAVLRVPLASKKGDNPGVIKALDSLIANPRTPAADLPRYTFFRGSFALDSKDAASAVTYLEKARALNYVDANLGLLLARAYFEANMLDKGIAQIDSEITSETAKGKVAPEAWYRYAVDKLAKAGPAKKPEVTAWLVRWIKAYPTPANWHLVTRFYRDNYDRGTTGLQKGERIDLMRLMMVSGGMASEDDYIELADLARNVGLPYETKLVIEAGRSSGKVRASNVDANEYYKMAVDSIKTEGSIGAYEGKARAAATGKPAAQTADAYLGNGDYAKAVDLYRFALTKGGVNADEVNTRIGIALARSGDKAGARAAFAQVAKTGSRGDIVAFWTAWLDTQGA